MVTIFIFSFIGFAIICALLAAFTTVLYRNKSFVDLSLQELKMLHRDATILERLSVFFMNLISSVFASPVYILAGIATLIASFLI
jgi:hypothetical protein